jgi:molybdate transport system ATP-binding protein
LADLEHVNVTMRGTRVLDDVSLTVRRGEHLLLFGPNGAGKSMLLRLLRGEIFPDQENGGRVRWFPHGTGSRTVPEGGGGDGAPLTGRAMTSLLSPSSQEHCMRLGWRVSGEELALAALHDDWLLYREAGREQRERARSIARRLRAENLLDRGLASLSQGQLRLILLIRALIRRPELLLLDEAADGLDASGQAAFLDMLESLLALPSPPTLVFTTHRPRWPGFFRRAVLMERGRLIGPADPEPLPQRETRRPAPPPPPDRPEGMRILLQNATVYVDRVKVLRGLDWEIKPGEQWLLLGASGSGKSTLLRALIGEEHAAEGGRIRRFLGAEEITELAVLQKNARMVSDRLQALRARDDSAEEVVFSGFDGCAGVYRDAGEDEKDEVRRLLDEAGLGRHARQPFRSLSSGQARRILLARALAGAPRLLLLDEPFSGLDRQSRAGVIALLESRIRQGLQTVLVTHHEEDRLPSSTHLACLEDGMWKRTPAPLAPAG